jgi:hypothetical protein
LRFHRIEIVNDNADEQIEKKEISNEMECHKVEPKIRVTVLGRCVVVVNSVDAVVHNVDPPLSGTHLKERQNRISYMVKVSIRVEPHSRLGRVDRKVAIWVTNCRVEETRAVRPECHIRVGAAVQGTTEKLNSKNSKKSDS